MKHAYREGRREGRSERQNYSPLFDFLETSLIKLPSRLWKKQTYGVDRVYLGCAAQAVAIDYSLDEDEDKEDGEEEDKDKEDEDEDKENEDKEEEGEEEEDKEDEDEDKEDEDEDKEGGEEDSMAFQTPKHTIEGGLAAFASNAYSSTLPYQCLLIGAAHICLHFFWKLLSINLFYCAVSKVKEYAKN
nr:hypothetical transcript [Hymenolepis microstoma]